MLIKQLKSFYMQMLASFCCSCSGPAFILKIPHYLKLHSKSPNWFNLRNEASWVRIIRPELKFHGNLYIHFWDVCRLSTFWYLSILKFDYFVVLLLPFVRSFVLYQVLIIHYRQPKMKMKMKEKRKKFWHISWIDNAHINAWLAKMFCCFIFGQFCKNNWTERSTHEAKHSQAAHTCTKWTK